MSRLLFSCKPLIQELLIEVYASHVNRFVARCPSIRQHAAEFDDRPTQFRRRRRNVVSQIKPSHIVEISLRESAAQGLRQIFRKACQALSENSLVGPRSSGFSLGKDGEAGDIGFIVDAAGCSQADNKPLGGPRGSCRKRRLKSAESRE